MSRQRYRTYRGKGRKAPVLAVLCVLLAGAAIYGFVWLFEHMSMNADGTITVNMPGFLSPAPVPTPTPTPEPLEIVVAPSGTAPVAEPSLAPAPTPRSASPRAVLVSQETLGSPDALAQVKAGALAAGANTLVLDYKSNEGAVLTPEDWDAACTALGPGFEYVARISLFLDDTTPRRRNALAVKHADNPSWNWIGADGRWLNPFREAAADYLLSVIEEAAALGPDGILLDNLCFPWYGQTSKIFYGADNETPRTEAIEAFCARLDGLGLALPVSAVALHDTVLNGVQEVAGQDLARMKARFDTLYVEWPDPLEPLAEGFLPILTEPPAEGWERGWLAAP